MDLDELEIDVRYNYYKDEYITINGRVYSMLEAYKIAINLLNGSNEIFDCINHLKVFKKDK